MWMGTKAYPENVVLFLGISEPRQRNHVACESSAHAVLASGKTLPSIVKYLKNRNGVALPCRTYLYCLRRRALLRFFIYSTIDNLARHQMTKSIS